MRNGKVNLVACVLGIWLILAQNAHAMDSNKVVCVTDKETYEQGENVIATITNGSSYELSIADRTHIDGGFATIDMKHNDETWHAIDLYTAANIISSKTLKKEESHVYIWKTIGYNRMDTVAAPGIYRITFNHGIRSNQFIITEKRRSQ